MPLRLYNTLTRRLEAFEPLEEGLARVYACGPTVYRSPHIGNYRAFLFNDLLHRTLRWKGYRVRFVMNLTDVDDKTIDGALRSGVALDAFTEPVVRSFFDELDRLGTLRAEVVFPRATRNIAPMLDLVARLLQRGHAYVVDGSVYYDISSFPGYGKLSRVELDRVRRGERVAADEYGKEDVRDFALWKAARDVDRQVGAVWPAPWGDGRPGWHLECSAMSMAELGETFDIHTGGEDLIFPHHEDEIAQSEGATGKPFVRYWLHVKHLLVNGEKMAKSRGNVFTIPDLVERGHSPAAIRYLLLSGHYRRELNFTVDGLDDARAAIRRLLDFHERLRSVPVSEPVNASAPVLAPPAAAALAGFEAALDDDLNVPAALASVFNFVREANAALDRRPHVAASDRGAALSAIDRVDEVLGVLSLARAEAEAADPELAAWVERLLEERRQARRRRDFARADAIRDELAGRGVVVEDTPQGTRWKRAT